MLMRRSAPDHIASSFSLQCVITHLINGQLLYYTPVRRSAPECISLGVSVVTAANMLKYQARALRIATRGAVLHH